MKYETAGDPMTTRKWTRKATRKVSRELKKVGIAVSRGTVGRLLTQLNYRLRVNWKKKSRGSPKERDRQFRRIFAIRQHFESNGLPVISVDTKKKELVGNFKNAGVAWTKAPFIANDHDFRSDAIGVAWPQGIFDTGANRGFVAVGTSHATPSFAADALVRWWENDGASRYPGADHILVLADAGGCNGCGCHAGQAAARTALRSGRRVSSTACPQRSLRASARNCTMCCPVFSFQRDPHRLSRSSKRLLHVASTLPLPRGRPMRRARA